MDNNEILKKVMKERLESSLSIGEAFSEESKQTFREAMEATDRYIALEKIKAEEREKEKNREFERDKFESDKKDKVFDKALRVAEVVAVPLIVLGVKQVFDIRNIKLIGKVEQMETFVSTPGKKIVGGLFGRR